MTLSRIVAQRQSGRFFSAQEPPPKLPPPSPKRGWRDPGTLSIRLGWSLLALLFIDQGLQYQQRTARTKFFNDLEKCNDPKEDAQVQEWMNQPSLYTCIVRRVPDMDGYKSLKHVKVGHEIEVLQEKAGPDEMYSVCRTRDENGVVSVGWFPAVDLEPAKKPRRWYKLW
jgi:hypothetical protein